MDWLPYSHVPQSFYGRQARKEKQDRHKNTELTKSAARQWYEANYEPVVATRANYEGTTVCMMKPKWENAKESNRRRYEVVEMPILVHGGRIMLDAEIAQKWKPGMKSKFIRNTAKIVVEKDKLTGRTRSFVMIFIGSYDYLKKTKSMEKTLTSTGSPISIVRYCSMKSTEHSLTDGSTKKGK